MNENQNPHPDTWKAFVLFIHEIARAKGITSETIAKRTGMHASSIRRMFQLRYCPSLEMWLKIIKAIEINIHFEDRESKTELNVLFEKAMTELGRRPDKLPNN